MKKLLLLTGSYWWWHNAAAFALKEYYQRNWWEVKLIDILDFINTFLAKSTKKFYKLSSEDFPAIWEAFFNITDYPIVSRILYWIKDPILQPKFDEIIQDFQPDNVISVFPFWNWWVKNFIKKNPWDFKWWIVITDAINIQSFWYVKPEYVDKYFVIDEFSKKKFIKKFNYPENKVEVSFFPILPEKFINKKNIWNKKVLILLTGLEENFVDKFLSITNADVTIIKWRNDNLYADLKKKYGNNFDFCEFINILDSLKKYDIFIWKPWWAITSECIATDTFMFVPSYFPWQEEGNLQLLLLNKCWLYENNAIKLEFLRQYLDFNKLAENFRKVKKPNSCEIILSTLNY